MSGCMKCGGKPGPFPCDCNPEIDELNDDLGYQSDRIDSLESQVDVLTAQVSALLRCLRAKHYTPKDAEFKYFEINLGGGFIGTELTIEEANILKDE